MKKRILALALSLCMMLSMMPTAYADEGFLTLDGQQPEVSQHQEQPQQQEGFLTLDGQLPESDEPSRQPEEGVLTLDQPDLEVQEPTTPIISEESEQNEGVLFVQCDFCGYLDGNHADDCATQQPEEEIIVVKPAAERKAAIVYSFTYQDTFDALMEADTLSVFESILDELTASQLEEFYDLLSDDELDALDELEEDLAYTAVSDFKDEDTTKKTVTVETRVSAFGGAQREMLRQLGYELIVDMFGWIVDAIDLPQNDYTVMEAVSPETSADYQWQILADDDLWVDIYNETDSLIRVSYAMVANLLDRHDAVQVRCEITGEDGISYTDPVEVTVDYTSEDVIIDAEAEPIVEDLIVEEGVVEDVVIEEPIVEEPIVEEPIVEEPIVEEPIVEEPIVEEPIVEEPIVEEPIVEEPIVEEPIVEEPIVEEPVVGEPVAQTFSVTRLGGTYAQPFTVSLLSTEEETPPEPVNVVIKYVFYSNGSTAASEYKASVISGNDFYVKRENPVVKGYKACVIDENNLPVESTALEINLENVTEDKTFYVYYLPTTVTYTVNYMFESVDGSEYVSETEKYPPKTCYGLTESQVNPDDFLLKDDVPGFEMIWYDTPKIAADGETVVNVYYDRLFVLMLFDLNGGYGVEPIYARYGTSIEVGTPTRQGYTFTGWSSNVPTTVPASKSTYTAQWTANGGTSYTVVYWAENANDSNYSYWGSATKTATSGAKVSGSDDFNGTTALPKAGFHFDHADTEVVVKGDGSSVVNVYYKRNTYTLIFAYEDGSLLCNTHVHSTDCYQLTCELEEHEHTYEGKYSTGGFIGIGATTYYVGGCYADGDVSNKTGGSTTPTCGIDEHEHTTGDRWTASCFGDELICGQTGVNNHTHSVANGCYGMKFENVKYGQATDAYWAQAPAKKWLVSPYNDTFYTNAPAMPNSNLTIYGTSSYGSSTIHYYEYVNGQETTNRVRPDYVVNDSGWSFTEEDYIVIPGFTFKKADKQSSTQYIIYYTRNSYNLSFKNGSVVTDKGNKLYEADLSGEYWVPTYNGDNADAYTFGGWYTTEGCVAGTEFSFAGAKMPSNNLILYAKWVPVNRTVNVYISKQAMDENTKYVETITVQHGSFVPTDKIPEEPTNGALEFIGWFYMDGGTEKAFDFENMPVNKDLSIYAKWDDTTPVEYTIRYIGIDENNNRIEIADQETGKALSGGSATFDAKSGNQLYEAYQEGWFPETNSHTLEFSATNASQNVYEFLYHPADNIPYKVRYLIKNDDGTTTHAIENPDGTEYIKIVDPNRSSVVTETFVVVPGYMPDAYQKQLIVSTTGTNEIIFYYHVDNVNAYYALSYWLEPLTENPVKEDYLQYGDTLQRIGEIGETVQAEPININGFTYVADMTEYVVGDNAPVIAESATLTADSLELKHYYKRNLYDYVVKYLDKETGDHVADEKTVKNTPFGKVVSENAIDVTGYELISSTSQEITIKNGTNEIIFYYQEKEVTINYKVVGPNGCGTVDLVNEEDAPGASVFEEFKAVNGSATGATATISNDCYEFVGWFSDSACTTQVDSSWIRENTITPEKPAGGWAEKYTYYAKFVEKEVAINYVAVGPEGCGTVDPDSETVKVLTGTATGSTATASDNVYKFVGWYDNATCTGDPISTNAAFVPSQPGRELNEDGTVKNYGVWPATNTYYAKFEYNLTSLTIRKTWESESTYGQDAIFTVIGEDKTITVVIPANSTSNEVTITGLTVDAEYTITENTDWAWRYTSSMKKGDETLTDGKIKLEPTGNLVICTNNIENQKWFDGNAYCENVYVPANNTIAQLPKREDEE